MCLTINRKDPLNAIPPPVPLRGVFLVLSLTFYKSCQSCLNKIGDLSNSDYQSGLAAQAVCDSKTGNARSITQGGSSHLLAVVLVAVGAGIGGAMV